jgi:hypothetical protein
MPPPNADLIPVPAAASGKDAIEILRAFVVDGRLHVTLRPGFEQPEIWGMAVADIARHAARMFASETKITEQAALEKIRHMFDAELDSPTDLGATNRVS